jgi:NodT family efflux transporter outer membrane factor (OMF) lipoprotein
MPTRSTAAKTHMLDTLRAKHSRRPAGRTRSLLASSSLAGLAAGLFASGLTCGCTSPSEYVHNGFKVGPNYCPPSAQVAQTWIDASDKRVRTETVDISRWWRVFNDDTLEGLVREAYNQNLTLREAGFRILEARAQLAISVGNFFPQRQTATGDYTRNAASAQTANNIFQFPINGTRRFYSQWDLGFNLAWELDFWGRFRRAIESNEANLEASVADYDDVLVTLLGDVASNYVQYRTLQQQIEFSRFNVELQKQTLTIVEARFKAGTTSELDVRQSRSTLAQTEATIPELEISLRQAANRLCTLMGIPPEDLAGRLGKSPIPTAPVEAAVGIPADLLRRRPDVRRAEKLAAAQSAQIGIAEADFYPAISVVGTIGWSAEEFPNLFQASALQGTVGPMFQWKILNYGRIWYNVKLQKAKFQELVTAYEQSVLSANQEAENGLVTFLRAQSRTKLQSDSVDQAQKAVALGLVQYKAGTVDFTRITQLEQTLVLQQNTLAEARGEIAQGLIQTYRALGGGWQIRCPGQGLDDPMTGEMPSAAPPAPAPNSSPAPAAAPAAAMISSFQPRS